MKYKPLKRAPVILAAVVLVLVCGLRLLNPVFSTVSVIALSAAVHAIVAPQSHQDASSALLTGGFCFTVGAAALASCVVDLRRLVIAPGSRWCVRLRRHG